MYNCPAVGHRRRTVRVFLLPLAVGVTGAKAAVLGGKSGWEAGAQVGLCLWPQGPSWELLTWPARLQGHAAPQSPKEVALG